MKKILALVLCAMLMLASVSALAESGEKVHLEFFNIKPEVVDILDTLIAKFEEENPDIDVEQTQVPDATTVLLAVLLNQKLKLQGFWRVTYFFPAVMSSITIGLIFNQIYYHVVPLVGKSLGIALLSKNPLSNRNLAMWAIMLIQIWKETAVPTVLILAALQSISSDLYEAATIDGATGTQCFWNITLPLVKPTVGVAALMSIRSGLMMFDYVKATTNGGPANATTTIAVSIFKHAFTDMKFAYSSAESILVFIVIMLIALVQIKMVQERD